MTDAGAPLLAIEGLKLHYPVKAGPLGRVTGHVRAVDGVDIGVNRGETVGIVGESGSGKTTVAKCAVGLVRPTAGRVVVDGNDINAIGGSRLRSLRRHFQMIFQDPYASLTPHMRVEAIISEPLVVQGITKDRTVMGSEVERWLDLVGLSRQVSSRYPHELSGGQRQRVAIARALVLHPRIVVCDEPLSALDAVTQERIADLLMRLQRELALSYVLISHDISVVRYMSTRIYVMYLGQVVETADSAEMSRNPLHPYTQALWSAVPSADPNIEAKRQRIVLRGDVPSPLDVPAGCRFHPRCPMFIPGTCDREEPKDKEVRPGHVVRCHLYR